MITKLAEIIRRVVFDNSTETRKDLNESLNEFVDYRVNTILEEKRSDQSQERMAVIDSINSSVRSTASTVRSITALNSAPKPLNDDATPEEIEKWFKKYREWFETKREEGLKI